LKICFSNQIKPNCKIFVDVFIDYPSRFQNKHYVDEDEASDMLVLKLPKEDWLNKHYQSSGEAGSIFFSNI
jgi:hypothetical protein